MKSNTSEKTYVDYKVSGRRVTGTQAKLDRMPFKECALAVELSGNTNRCLQLPLYIWGMKSNIAEKPDVDYKVSGRRVTGTQAMLDLPPFKERALAVELGGHTNRCLQMPLCIWGMKSKTSEKPYVDYKVSGPTVTWTQAMLH